MDQFVNRVLREAAIWAGSPLRPRLAPQTVFIGGGTPSLLSADAMRRLICGLRRVWGLSAVGEWTIEANPATVDATYCRMLRELGVDRLSFGAQSFRKAELATLERHHDPEDVPRTIAAAQQAGFERLNVDLIYAIPGQDLQSWRDSLDAALSLGTEHLSCYGLTYEPNTPMAVRRRLGQIQAVEESVELQMLRHARQRLAAAGRPAYEISNYAIPGRECLHNLMYWNGGNYIGLGPSAASHIEGWRWRNRPHLGEWETAVDSDALPAIEVEQLTPAQRAGELAMLMLRLARGVEFDAFRAKTGRDARSEFAEQIQRLSGPGLIEVDARGFRLTDQGLAVADSVAAEFLAEPAQQT